MNKLHSFLTVLVLFFSSLAVAQPVLGVTDFSVSGTISWNSNSPCVSTKTADVQGWLVSVNSTSNCGINQSNSGGFSDSDGRLQYLVGFGTLSQASFGSDDGSQFALRNLAWSISTYSFANASINFIGYRNGTPVPGATLTAVTPPTPWGTTSNLTVVSFTSNPNFANVDNVLIVPTQTCSSILALEYITTGSPTICTVSPTLTIAGSTSVSCNGGSNGTATVSASGSGPFTYSWSPSGGTGASISGRTAGVYTVVVTNSCSISATQTVNITQPSALVTSTAVTNVVCNGGSNGVASISASGGAGSYTYLWSNGAGTSAITGRMAGAYTATVTDANSCTSIKSAVITQPSALVTTTAVTNVACNGGNGSATITASGGTSSYTYSWSTTATTSSVSGLVAGAYTATVTDAYSCTSIKSVSITQPSALVTTTAVTNLICNGGSNGSATITASGGTGAYTYSWSTAATSSVVSGLVAGAYTATVTDANSCTSIKPATITQPSALVTTTAVTNLACNGGSNGSATITASGGTGAYTYSWSTAATSSVTSGLVSGAYTATVTDANSCTSIKPATITQPSALVTTTAVANVACNGSGNGSATITASGGTGAYTYSWSTAATSSVISGLVSGAYTATVTDANSCTSIKPATITQPSALVTTTAVTNVACNGSGNGSATITASGGTGAYTYSWSTAATSSVISGLVSGAYTATVTDANSCISIKSATITQPSALVTTTAVTNVACNGGNGSATITASGGTGAYTYSWSNGATASVAVLPAAAHTATVTDANNCTSIKSITITQPSALVTTTALTNALCNGGNGSATITASGGTGSYTYLWSNGATASVAVLPPGARTATVTDANSCTSIKSVTITQPSALVTTTAATNALCNGNGSATITATGGTGAFTYSWSTGATTSVISQPAGTYTATVTDANSCTSVKQAVISQPSSLLASTAVTSVICNGGTGSATITASGGTGAYSYSWSTSATTSVVTLAAGNYTATVTDGSNCSVINFVTIAQPAALNASISVTNPRCQGGFGSATVTATGGSGSYNYTWSNSTVGNSIAFAYAGNYSVTVSAANCSASITASAVVVDPPAITYTYANMGILCHGGVGSASVNATGGSGTFNYLWSTGSTSQIITNRPPGTYSVTISDTYSCSQSTSFTFIDPPALVANVSFTSPLCNGGTGNVSVTASGGTTPYNYSLTALSFGPAFSGVSPGAYTLITKDANSCSVSNAFTLTQPTSVSLTAAANFTSVCAGSASTLTAGGSGGTGAFSYSWAPGSSNSATYAVTPSSNTTYTATASDVNGCITTKTVAVATLSLPVIAASGGSVCSGKSFTISPSGASTYTYSGGSAIVSPAGNTSYTVTGTSTAGCVSLPAVITITVNSNPTITVNSATICSGASVVITPTGAASYTVTGGTFTVTPSLNTSYSVTGMSTSGCVSGTVVSTVSVNASPTITVNSATICPGASVVITPTGAVSYSVTGNSFTVTPAVTTNYSVTATNANGCVSSAVAGIFVKTSPTLSVSDVTVCSGASAVITPTGAATYTITGNSFTVSPGTTTSYSVTGTGTNGCAAFNTVVATVFVNLTPTISVSDMTTCAGVAVTITPNGADTYTIVGNSFTVNPAATVAYAITGTGVNGCLANTVAVTVFVNPNPTITVNSGTVCSGSAFTIMPNGATAYTISGNAFTVSPTADSNYTVTGSDANGCVSDAVTSSLTVNALPALTASASSATVCAGETVILTAQGASTYSWTNYAATASVAVTVSATTVYEVTGTDPNGCTATYTLSEVTELCLSINNRNANVLSVSVYPNPNNGQFVIQSPEGIQLEIANVLGQTVYSNVTTGTKTEISIAHLSNGIYFVKAAHGAAQQIIKIIKE